MSTISTTITHNIYYGAGLTYLSPLTITSTGAVISTAAGKAAVQGSGGGTLISNGTIIDTASGASGVVIDGAGGTVNNSGFIQGYVRGLYMDGAGFITNSGTILATGNGAQAAVVTSGGGTLINSGTIINSATIGNGVKIQSAGGSVVNSGLMRGYFAGLAMEATGVITNTGSGTILATGANSDGVLARGGSTLTNQGTVIESGSGGTGVSAASGAVINSGLVKGYDTGVYMSGSGAVTNFGTIQITAGFDGHAGVEFTGNGTLTNDGTISGNDFGAAGVEFGGLPGTVMNSGLIIGYFTGLEMGGTGVAINTGTIETTETPFILYQADVQMYAGSFTNATSGVVNNGVFLSDGTPQNVSSTVVNAGSVNGGIALNLNSESPNGFPVYTYYGSGTVFLSGTVTGDPTNPFPIQFGGTSGLLVLEHGYDIVGTVLARGVTHPHTIELLGSAGASVTVHFNPTTFTNFGTVSFGPGAGNYGTLALAGSADIPGTIAAFTGPHDVVDLGFISDTSDNATAVLNPSTDKLTVTGDNGSAVLQLATGESYPAFKAVPDAAGTGTDVEIICFCRGTRILTDHGEVPVETLKIGDQVRLLNGRAEPIVWIGEGRVLATRGRRSAATPVIVRRGALAGNVPNRDLHITKAHALYVDGALIPVEFLVNHRSIVWDDRAQEVLLYHIELATHGVLVANGAPAESYRDDGNRWLFQNANSGWHLPPKPACAPVLTGGPLVDAVWRRLLDGSGPRRGLPLTDDPDLHLLVDGVRLDAARELGGVHVFRLPRVPDAVRIISRAAIPQELGLARDPRSLGVALRRIAARRASLLRIIEADDPLLAEGFHAFEADNGFRWTTGDAVLPHQAFAGFTGPMEIALTVAGSMQYIDEGERLMVA